MKSIVIHVPDDVAVSGVDGVTITDDLMADCTLAGWKTMFSAAAQDGMVTLPEEQDGETFSILVRLTLGPDWNCPGLASLPREVFLGGRLALNVAAAVLVGFKHPI